MEIADLFGCEDLESIERKIDFERMLEGLSERDQKVICLYAEGRTQAEIGAVLGLSQRRIGQIIANISKMALKCH